MSRASHRSAGNAAFAILLAMTLLAAIGLPPASVRADEPPDHLVVSEVVTGGASASDEFIEIYNPTAAALPLEGLELIYVTASGATISRRAAWALGTPELGPGRHLLVANELGAYAGIADALYASGMASTGGSVALRIQGAGQALDAVGWGSAASLWIEGRPAPAPPAGSSLERLPGGSSGSTSDTDDNLADFAIRIVPEPQNAGSAAVPDPGATPPPPSPTPAQTVEPTTTPTQAPTSEPTPEPTVAPTGPGATPIATARGLPDGTVVTLEATALTASDFTDGGGFVADETGGIAVLATGTTFVRGDRLRLVGTLDDRFSQRTLRVDASGLTTLGMGGEPSPVVVRTGAIAEDVEGELVRVQGDLVGSPSMLTAGLAFDLDDGSGPARLIVATASGIDVAAWGAGTRVELVGVVGQRDSTGSGTTGYRVHPRDTQDVLSVGGPPSPTPLPSASDSPEPTSTAEPPEDVLTIAEARELPKNARARVRGTVTMAPGVVDPTTAVLQDASAAIVLRIGDEVGPLALGEVVQVDGIRSTKGGMETLRVALPPVKLGHAPGPTPQATKTGDAGEALEARLVVVRGALVASARRGSSGSVTFEVNDGSGPLRVSVGAAVGVEDDPLGRGVWVEVTGVLGQDTTGALPLRGYRIWPRRATDLRVIATPTEAAARPRSNGDSADAPDVAAADLEALGGPAGPSVRIGATLVAGEWPELGIGGVLWDGERVVALDRSAVPAVRMLLGSRRPPVSVELSGLRATGATDDVGVPIVRLGEQPDALIAGAAPPIAPATELPADGDGPRWVAVVGRLEGRGGRLRLWLPSGEAIDLDLRCDRDAAAPNATVGARGIATASPSRIVVACGGLRAAPGLARSGAVHRPMAAASEARLAGVDGLPPDPQPAPFGAALLLGLAAVGLIGGGLVARRRAADDPEPEPADVDAPGEVETISAPPALTVVPMTRDRAP